MLLIKSYIIVIINYQNILLLIKRYIIVMINNQNILCY